MQDIRGQKTLNGIQMSTLLGGHIISLKENQILSGTPMRVALGQQIFHLAAMVNPVCDQSLYVKKITNASIGQRLMGTRW